MAFNMIPSKIFKIYVKGKQVLILFYSFEYFPQSLPIHFSLTRNLSQFWESFFFLCYSPFLWLWLTFSYNPSQCTLSMTLLALVFSIFSLTHLTHFHRPIFPHTTCHSLRLWGGGGTILWGFIQVRIPWRIVFGDIAACLLRIASHLMIDERNLDDIFI